MIFRVYTACPGCDAPTVVRVGVAVEPGERQPFSVRCLRCESTIYGRLITTESADVSVQLEEAPLLEEDASTDWQVITVHPSFPFMPASQTSPFIDVGNVLGDATLPYFQAVGQFNGLAAEEWPKLERAYQFYLGEDWSRFDKMMARLLEDSWPNKPNMVTRHDFVHRLLTVMIAPLDPMGFYGDAQKEIWQRAEPSEALITYVRQPFVQAEFTAFQKKLFRQISHLIKSRDMWTPGLPYLWLNRLGQDVPSEWRLPGNDFAVLRGAYQHNYELSCQALSMLVFTQNAADGRPATAISVDGAAAAWIPTGISGNVKPPKTLGQFKKLNAESKQAYLDWFPVTEKMWLDAFDRNIRNAIAHADIDEVIATGQIVTGKGRALTYLSFVESVAKQLELLLLWLNLVKLFRVYGVLAKKEQ